MGLNFSKRKDRPEAQTLSELGIILVRMTVFISIISRELSLNDVRNAASVRHRYQSTTDLHIIRYSSISAMTRQ